MIDQNVFTIRQFSDRRLIATLEALPEDATRQDCIDAIREASK